MRICLSQTRCKTSPRNFQVCELCRGYWFMCDGRWTADLYLLDGDHKRIKNGLWLLKVLFRISWFSSAWLPTSATSETQCHDTVSTVCGWTHHETRGFLQRPVIYTYTLSLLTVHIQRIIRPDKMKASLMKCRTSETTADDYGGARLCVSDNENQCRIQNWSLRDTGHDIRWN